MLADAWQRTRQELRQRYRRLRFTVPRTWPEARRRVLPLAAQIGRPAGAAVLAFLASKLPPPHVTDLTAPLTALLVVQASTVSTLRMGMIRVGAVVTGVLIAVAFSAYVGLSWWSLAAVIVIALLLARVLHLAEQSLETAISAMLILGVSGLAAEVRLVSTLVGAVVGIAISLLVPAGIPNTRARDAVRDVARAQATLLAHIGDTLSDRPPDEEDAARWADQVDTVGRTLAEASAAVDHVAESRKLNARALAALRIDPELRVALARLQRCRAAESAMVEILRQKAASVDAADDDRVIALRGAFAVLLESLAAGMNAFGDLVSADQAEPANDALERLVELVAETRAMLADLILINVDARPDSDLWMLQGSMLAAIEQLLRQLDLEQPEQATAAWNPRPSLERVPRTLAQTRQKLSEPVRRRR